VKEGWDEGGVVDAIDNEEDVDGCWECQLCVESFVGVTCY